MRYFSRHPRARWVAPAAFAAALLAVPSVTQLTASADVALPPRTAEQLLVDLQQAKPVSLSGTVVQKADLGLPALPESASSSELDAASLASGTHRWRVWTNGSSAERVSLLGRDSESTIVRNGANVWVWSSSAKTATRYTGVPTAGSYPQKMGTLTPDEAAKKALAAIEPTTTVTTDRSSTVAGQDAYELVLTPKTTATKVKQVRIAVDAVTHLPLRVQVLSTTTNAVALEVGFGELNYTAPKASVFSFTPPAGAKVVEKAVPALPRHAGKLTAQQKQTAKQAEPTTVGKGWATVEVFTLPKDAASKATATSGTNEQLGQLLTSLPQVSGTWGSGRLLTGTLFSAVLSNDGRVAVGAVAPEQLYAALSVK